MKVSELASLLDITADTVRYYTREKLLNPTKGSNGYKFYSTRDLSQLKFILSARGLGFTIADIKNILLEAQQGKTACPMVREIIKQRLEDTEKQFQAMLALRQKMTDTLTLWEKMDDRCPTPDMVCHLIEHTETQDYSEIGYLSLQNRSESNGQNHQVLELPGGQAHDKK